MISGSCHIWHSDLRYDTIYASRALNKCWRSKHFTYVEQQALLGYHSGRDSYYPLASASTFKVRFKRKLRYSRAVFDNLAAMRSSNEGTERESAQIDDHSHGPEGVKQAHV